MAAARTILARSCFSTASRLSGSVARTATASNASTIAFYQPAEIHRFQSAKCFHSGSSLRSKETSWAKKGPITYKELKTIADQPTGEVTIIDVREPDEVSAGMIPSAVNVPLTQFEKSFNPNGGADFQQKFAFPRPSFNDPLVFYCRSGKRSAQALEVAKKGGWQK